MKTVKATPEIYRQFIVENRELTEKIKSSVNILNRLYSTLQHLDEKSDNIKEKKVYQKVAYLISSNEPEIRGLWLNAINTTLLYISQLSDKRTYDEKTVQYCYCLVKYSFKCYIQDLQVKRLNEILICIDRLHAIGYSDDNFPVIVGKIQFILKNIDRLDFNVPYKLLFQIGLYLNPDISLDDTLMRYVTFDQWQLTVPFSIDEYAIRYIINTLQEKLSGHGYVGIAE